MKKIVIVNRGGMPSEDLLALLKMVFPECEITGAFVLEGEVEQYVQSPSRRRGKGRVREPRDQARSIH